MYKYIKLKTKWRIHRIKAWIRWKMFGFIPGRQ